MISAEIQNGFQTIQKQTQNPNKLKEDGFFKREKKKKKYKILKFLKPRIVLVSVMKHVQW